jgi:hypothetical protein
MPFERKERQGHEGDFSWKGLRPPATFALFAPLAVKVLTAKSAKDAKARWSLLVTARCPLTSVR